MDGSSDAHAAGGLPPFTAPWIVPRDLWLALTVAIPITAYGTWDWWHKASARRLLLSFDLDGALAVTGADLVLLLMAGAFVITAGLALLLVTAKLLGRPLLTLDASGITRHGLVLPARHLGWSDLEQVAWSGRDLQVWGRTAEGKPVRLRFPFLGLDHPRIAAAFDERLPSPDAPRSWGR